MAERMTLNGRVEDPAITALAASMAQLRTEEREGLNHLRVVHRFVGKGRALIREGEPVTLVRVLCKGWAMRCRTLDGSRRQILDFALPGDIVGVHLDGLGSSICDVVAATACEVGEVDVSALDRVAFHNRGVAAGLLKYLSRQLTQANDQMLRLGRMTAYERVCSFLLDIYARQKESADVNGAVDFPITQTVVADLLGLSVVHLNRQVMQLRREGLVTLSRRKLIIHDEQALAAIANYRDRRFAVRPATFLAAE